jgi:hypothetical protein
MTTNIEITDHIFAKYAPISYPTPDGAFCKWGNGQRIDLALTPLAKSLFNHLRNSGQQDVRGDSGHAEVVTYFSLALANLMGLTPEETEANVLAAILHDAGWGVVNDIENVWNALVTRRNDNNSLDAQEAAQEMAQLRFAHEKAATELAYKHLHNHPLVSDIAKTVADHDTRAYPPIPYMRAFLDGDWLWRVSVPCRLSRSSGEYDRTDLEAVYRQLQKEFKEGDFLMPWAYSIARIEAANTVRTMHTLFRLIVESSGCR